MIPLPKENKNYRPKREYKQRVQNDLKTGEIVDYIFLRCDYPSSHIKEIENDNVALQAECEMKKIPFTPIKPTHLLSGVQWKVAVVQRSRDEAEPCERVFEMTDEEVILPNFNIFSTVNFLTPLKHFEAKSKKGVRYGDVVREGGGDAFAGDNPEIVNMFPSVKESELEADDKARMEEWRSIFSWWMGIKEESEALKCLNNYIARRMLIYNKANKEKVEYYDIVPGTFGRAIVTRSNEDSKYFNLSAFSFRQKNDEGKYSREFYSTGGVQNEFGAKVAEAILKAEIEKYSKKENLTPNSEPGGPAPF